MIESLLAENLTLPHIQHGFFTRHGGVSEGIYASLNCGPGSNDDVSRVRENRQRVAATFGLPETQLLSAHQMHGAAVVHATAPWPMDRRPECDGMVTATPGLILGILTADCAPVLLADSEARVIGAAHAGWKGAFAGVIESTVTAMEKLGAKRERIHAAIGPCIAQASYEVGPEFVDCLVGESPSNITFFTRPEQGKKPHFSLVHYVKQKLQYADIKNIYLTDADTCAEEDRFFSFRRATLRKEGAYGRQISCIALE